jgi:hypothetical protein
MISPTLWRDTLQHHQIMREGHINWSGSDMLYVEIILKFSFDQLSPFQCRSISTKADYYTST